VKDDVAIPQAKRERLLSGSEARLRKLLMQRLLPPVERRKTLKEELDDFATGRPSARLERERKEREIEWQIDKCLYFAEPSDSDEPRIPDQLREFWEEQNKLFPQYDLGFHEALILLVETDLELEPETRNYISYELQRPRHAVQEKPGRKAREFAMRISRCKELLREAGLKALEAEAAIAQALGISVEALRKRCQRGRGPA
jgi:hypothetical protein